MDVRLPEIPLKLLSVFVDADGDIRVKEDHLREVLSSLRNCFGEVLDLVRLEFVEEVNALKTMTDRAQEELVEDVKKNYPTKSEFQELEAFVHRADNDLINMQRQIKAAEQRMKQMSSTAGTMSLSMLPSPSTSVFRSDDVRPSPSGREERDQLNRIERDIKDLKKSQDDILELRLDLIMKSDFEAAQYELEQQLVEAKTKITEEITELQGAVSQQRERQDDFQLQQQLGVERAETMDLHHAELRQEQLHAIGELRRQMEGQVAHLLGLNEALKTADMAQVHDRLATLAQDLDEVRSDLTTRAQGVWVERLEKEQVDLKSQVTQETSRLSHALQQIWPSLERSDEKERKMEAWSQQAAKQLQAVRSANGELIDDFQKVAKKAKEDQISYSERHQALTQEMERIRATLEFKEASNLEYHAMVEERLETLEMDLARETRRIEEKAEEGIQFLGSKLSTVEENTKDREQAVLFGARCLSCNRAYEDTLKTSGAVNLPGEKRKAQVFAEIQRALHSPRTDPQEAIKLIAVKVGRPCASPPSSKEGGPFAAGRDYSSMAFGIEDVQLLPMHAVSTSGARASGRGRGGGQGGHGARAARMRDLCTTPRPLQSPTDRCTWTFGRAQTTSPDLPGEGRFKTKAQAFEDLKAAIS